MKHLTTLLSIILMVFITSCNTVRVSSDYDRSANFDTYKTFAFHQKGLDKLKLNDLDKRRVVQAITNTLSNKSMSKASSESTADLIINISAKSKTKVEVDPFYDPWWGYGPYWGNSQRINQYKEGTIILDFVDRKMNTLIWQGVGEGLNVSDIESKADKIPVAVAEILEKYPPSK